MKGDIAQHLYDIQQAGTAIKKFVTGRTLDDYVQDEMLRSSIERKFEIIGEALNRMTRDAPQVLEHIVGYRDIISFRNILIHGYDSIDDRIVWDIIENELDLLLADVENLMKKETSTDKS